MKYINMKSEQGIETIDEFTTYKEAREMLKEYRLAYQGTGLYVYMSQRCTNEWKTK